MCGFPASPIRPWPWGEAVAPPDGLCAVNHLRFYCASLHEEILSVRSGRETVPLIGAPPSQGLGEAGTFVINLRDLPARCPSVPGLSKRKRETVRKPMLEGGVFARMGSEIPEPSLFGRR